MINRKGVTWASYQDKCNKLDAVTAERDHVNNKIYCLNETVRKGAEIDFNLRADIADLRAKLEASEKEIQNMYFPPLSAGYYRGRLGRSGAKLKIAVEALEYYKHYFRNCDKAYKALEKIKELDNV